MPTTTVHIHINGIVQGVGFRPFVYNLALKQGFTGWVRNSSSGVDIEVTGPDDQIKQFVDQIRQNPPPLAVIDSIQSEKIPHKDFPAFEIRPSANKETDFIPVSPDMAICADCQRELFNPNDRRSRYPFINCTNCGPRFTIIKDIPYDRPKTTMTDFAMCGDCQAEYENPLDRRFHAQPVACSVCGPEVWLENRDGEKVAVKDRAIEKAREALENGKIIALKGLGGFHLACDAANEDAIARLRERKQRPDKPFALMAYDLETIRKFVQVSSAARKILTSPQAPIVLLPRKRKTGIAESVAPRQNRLGFMLPYTPLHLLLLEPENGFPKVLVMTSGNLRDAPVIHQNQEARKKLGSIVDLFLMHNRPIHIRMDDSVVTLMEDALYPIRRARGYAPNPIRTGLSLPQILAVGPQMKNTFCLTRGEYAFLSHHIGEMENWETYRDYEKAISHYESLFRIQPELIACDLHPDYTTTQYARELAAKQGIPLISVQHHHAHLAAGLVENNLPPDQEVIALIYDGTGYGADQTIWGGEILTGNCHAAERAFFLKPVPLPGGDISIHKPARMALSMLWALELPWDDALPPVRSLAMMERQALRHQLKNRINTPLTSSMGRLFDAVSALLDIRQSVSYEAQAAIELEALADPAEMGQYPWTVEEKTINPKPLIEAILSDQKNKVPIPIISARFHNTIAALSLDICRKIRETQVLSHVVLSGGVWQNQFLLTRTMALLNSDGFIPLIHRQFPPNDGCVAFGQAMIAAHKIT